MNSAQRDAAHREVSNWQPWMICIWTKQQLQFWYDTHGPFGLYNGKMWAPKSRSLGVNRYEIRFVEYQP